VEIVERITGKKEAEMEIGRESGSTYYYKPVGQQEDKKATQTVS
jgi:hypothetical protein